MSQEAPGSRHCHGGTFPTPHSRTPARAAAQHSNIPDPSGSYLPPIDSFSTSTVPAPSVLLTDSERPSHYRGGAVAATLDVWSPSVEVASPNMTLAVLAEQNNKLLTQLTVLDGRLRAVEAALAAYSSKLPTYISAAMIENPAMACQCGQSVPLPMPVVSCSQPSYPATTGIHPRRLSSTADADSAQMSTGPPEARLQSNPFDYDMSLRIKDLPRCHDEPDEWIHHMTSLFTSLRRPLADVVPFIPLLLSGHAKSWFYELSGIQVTALRTWESWCEALRLGLRVQNYDAHKAHELRLRTLRRNESLADYYSARLKLQRAVMASAPDTHRIADLLSGLPVSWHAIIKAGLIGEGAHTLLAFRRVLLDLEPSLFAMRSRAEANRPSVRSSSLCRAVGDQQRRLELRERDTKSNWRDNPRSRSGTVFAQHARPVRVRPALPLTTRSPSLHVRTEPRKTRRAAWYRGAQRRVKTLFSCSNNVA
ncbi:hypothetical protein EXIGLDRAFT_733808 [Exidia glandulosa HHB12029]|uniref:Retrotransposon gag domain-containing protein n=1 Tax=Exidia glandulosa HHB12029 TaxID=1314781 RepID=A0A165B7Q7_EXIGL|nr:hypothetical protein EXIGLDRAFT_733808 [Exidia glandulosa HHB12029]